MNLELMTIGIWGAMLTYVALGSLILVRRRGNTVGRLFVIAGVSSLLGMAAQPLVVSSRANDPGDPVGAWLLPMAANLWVLSFVCLALLLVFFPDGRLPSRRWRPLLYVAGVVVVVGLLTSGGEMRPALVPAIAGPEAGEAIIELAQGLSGMGTIALIAAAAVALVARFRRSRGVERLQLKWIAYAGSLLGAAAVGTTLVFFSPLRALDPGAPYPPMLFGGVPFIIGLVAVPVGAAVAILRYRLYDIDVLINRTLVYGALSGALAATYVAGVLLLQSVLRPLTGSSEIAVAGSTLLVVALFQPLRRRIQDAVDRRFYRSRYDAARTIDRFSARLRDQVDLDALRGELVGVVHETVQPAHASLWLRRR